MTLQSVRSAFTRTDAFAALLLVLLTAFRFWYDTQHQLVQDESYYWQWSRHLDWGYYDNTPLMAPVIRLFTLLLGTNELGVRAGATVCALIAGVYIYLLAKRLLGPTVALASLVLANTVPLFAAGSVLMTQDPVQLALWAAALYVIQRALTDRPRWWIWAGILAGLATQAKLNALMLLPSVFLYILLSPPARVRWLRRPEPYLAGAIALLMLTPFLWWNHTHENAFWTHAHAMSSRGSWQGSPKQIGDFLGAQAVLLSPLVFLTYLYTLGDAFKRGYQERDEAYLFLWCPTAVSLAAILVTALKSRVEGNWAVDSYISGFILTAAVLVRCWDSRVAVKRVWVAASAALALFLTLAVALFPQMLYAVGVKYPNAAQDKTDELYGWRQMADRVTLEKKAIGDDPFVFGINYRMPSEAAFYLPGHPDTYALFLNYKASEYLFWENPSALIGKNAIF